MFTARVTEKNKHITTENKHISWKTCKAAPCKMRKGSTTACGRMAYFRPNDSRQVHAYNSDTEEWSTLPECPTYHFTLTVIENLVTAVGGSKFPWYASTIEKVTNTLLSLMQEGQRKNWVGHFPPMPTKRKLTAVVCSGKTW